MAEDTKDTPKDTPKPGAVPPVSPGEVEVEVKHERNRNVLWGPTQEWLRGAWSRKNLHSDELVEEIATMPDIPGMRIRLNFDRKIALVYDPLSLAENKAECERLQSLIKTRFRRDEGPAKATTREKMDADDLKTWLYWMRRFVDSKNMVVVKGTLPDLDTIEKLSGRRRIEMFNQSSRACKWREDWDRFVDFILSAGKQIPVV